MLIKKVHQRYYVTNIYVIIIMREKILKYLEVWIKWLYCYIVLFSYDYDVVPSIAVHVCRPVKSMNWDLLYSKKVFL